MKKRYILIIMIIILVVVVGFLVKNRFIAGEKRADDNTKVVETTVPKQPEVDPKVFELSLKNIFDEHQDLSKIDKKDLVTIIMTGDIIPGRHVNAKVVRYGDFTHPYLKTVDFLKDADLTVTNLEAPLTAKCAVTSEGMTFCGDQRHVQGLVFAGIDIASLANNHAGNYGASGIKQTQDLLTANGISPIGKGKNSIKDVKGTKFAFLAYNGVTESFDFNQMKADITAARKEADVVVVLPHWGGEYSHIPKTTAGIADDNPREVGKLLIDWGADLVLGNHPHWYQGVEIYKNKLIAYAHGNFIFDQEWSVETTQGVVGKYTFYKGKLVDASYSPIQIEDYNQPHFLAPPASTEILKIMKQSSFE